MKSVTGPLVKGLIFTVVTLVATIVLGVTIANKGSGDTIDYSAKFTDVTSLNVGDDIRMSGVRVGQVESIEVVDRRFSQVWFSVDRRWALSPTAIATVKFRNLIGQRYISVDQGSGSGTMPEDTVIPLDRTRPALDLTAMFNGFKPLFQALSPDDVNKLSYEVVQVLQGEGGTVDNLLTHIASLTTTLAQKDDVIGRVITNLNTVLGQVNSQGDQLSSLLLTTQQLVSGLAKDAKPIGEAIDGIGQLASSTADLLTRGREPLKRDIDALGALSNTLANNTPQFESFLKNLPIKYEAIGRVASYGSWLNFYLCSATTNVEPAPGQGAPGLPITAARCRS